MGIPKCLHGDITLGTLRTPRVVRHSLPGPLIRRSGGSPFRPSFSIAFQASRSKVRVEPWALSFARATSANGPKTGQTAQNKDQVRCRLSWVSWVTPGDGKWLEAIHTAVVVGSSPAAPTQTAAPTRYPRRVKSRDITFSCGFVLILEHYTLRAALSSVCDPGGSERR